MHRLRNQSMHFHTQQQVEYLNQQNEKIINKLMGIAKRKASSFFKPEEPTMVYFENPARKRSLPPYAGPRRRYRRTTSPSPKGSSPNTQNSKSPTRNE